MKNFKGTIVFAVVVAVVVGFAIFEYKKLEKESRASEQQGYLLSPYTSNDLKSLNYQGQLSSFSVRRDEEGWWKMLQPFEDSADEIEMGDFLDGLVGMPTTLVDTEGYEVDWDQYGFSEPLAVLEFTAIDGNEITLTLGSVRGFDDSFHIRKEGDPHLYIGDRNWASFTNRTAMEFRNRSLFPYEGVVRSLRVRTPKMGQNSILFERVDGAWTPTENPDFKIDEISVEDYISRIQNLRAARVVEEASSPSLLQKYKLNRPAFEFDIELDQEMGRFTLQASAKESDTSYVILSDRDPIYRISWSSLEPLNEDRYYFKNKSYPFEYDFLNVKKVELNLSGHGEKHTIELSGEEWISNSAKVNQAQIINFLNTLRLLNAATFREVNNQIRRQVKENKIIIYNPFDQKSFEMSWGGKTEVDGESLVYVMTNLSNQVALVEEDDLQDLSEIELFVEDEE